MADSTISAPPRPGLNRSNSISQQSENSQTAAEFISSQLQLEADAREALPYQFDTCTRPLGALRQSLFSCLTCNPPPVSPDDPYTPAGVCYSCSISCHGEHTLVELFSKRNFVCDCGTTRIPANSPCTLRLNEATRTKGVTSDEPAASNRYNPNFRNRFCGCGEDYDPHQERGTMFQCMGLGTVEDGGCGEDWWHPECLVGISRSDWKKHVEETLAKNKALRKARGPRVKPTNGLATVQEQAELENGTHDVPTADVVNENSEVDDASEAAEDEDDLLPDGFPHEDDFEFVICYKCTDAFPWIKQYAGAPGFLPGLEYMPNRKPAAVIHDSKPKESKPAPAIEIQDTTAGAESIAKKRKAEDEDDTTAPTLIDRTKRQKSEQPLAETSLLSETPDNGTQPPTCILASLPPASTSQTTLFLTPSFRTHLCKCPAHFPLLVPHPQLLDEEETYEPPLSGAASDAGGGASVGTGSLLDRGEAAFSNMDRVRAIEGAMVYAQLKDKVKSFLQPFAESGQAVGAEDIKAYFEKLRGDVEAMKDARGSAKNWRKGEGGEGDGDGADGRKEQSGY